VCRVGDVAFWCSVALLLLDLGAGNAVCSEKGDELLFSESEAEGAESDA
jgi:hypothetical protein